jgi:hypothetical protein
MFSLSIRLFLTLLASASAVVAEHGPGLLPQPNPGFEDGLLGWIVNEDVPMSTVHPQAARTGERGLRVIDESTTAGSSVASQRFPVEPGLAYRLTISARRVSGDGVGVFLRFFDADGRHLNAWPRYNDQVTIRNTLWREHSIIAAPPEGAVTVDGWIRAFQGSVSVSDFDDFRLEAFIPVVEPPWEPQYKLSPDETDRLTPADVPGPDGLVYPDWSRAGVPGGIPDDIPEAVGPERFADLEDTDIAPLLNRLIEEVAANGGGTIQLPPGRFLLESPVIIRRSGVVLRGSGRDQTHLLYQEHIPYGTLRAHSWTPSGIIGPNGFFEIQANPKNLVRLRVSTVDGVRIKTESRRHHWGNRFNIRFRGEELLELLGPGRHSLHCEISYANGDRFSDTFEVEISAERQSDETWVDQHGALMILGGGFLADPVLLAATGKRGDTQLQLVADHGISPADTIMIEAVSTPRWNAIVGNVAPWGTFRSNHYLVTAVEGDTVHLDQPLRIDFPIEDDSYVRRLAVTSGSGFESLTIEQKVFTTELVGPRIPETLWYPMADLWSNGVTFSYAWGCWVRDVDILNSGRNPLYFTRSKFSEARDIHIEGAIFRGGGGTGYVGFERTFDSLMDGIVTHGMRHAPNVQWGSAGNVVRNSHFTGSDGQWHAGWTHENLYELNVIEQTSADLGQGTYGNALFASGPTSAAHGPQGPRNVVYNNDLIAPRDGLHMAGGNEAWIVLYNRFVLEKGRAVYGREMSFDHIISNNVFVLRDPPEPAVLFGAADCTGIELVNNAFYGPIQTVAGFNAGLGKFARLEGNTVEALPASGELPPRPTPAISSIFEWQRANSSLTSSNGYSCNP